MARPKGHLCNLCGYRYPESDLVIHKESRQLVCKNCLLALKELDQEQEDIETMMREERKMKAGIY